jgi:hypothetical protein
MQCRRCRECGACLSAFEPSPPLSRVSIKKCVRLWTLQAAEIGDVSRLPERCRWRRMAIGRAVERDIRRDTSWSALPTILEPRVARTSSSTSSWRRICSGGSCTIVKRFIIGTAFDTTIVPRTSSCGRPPSHQASGSVMPLNGRTPFSSSTRALVHLQQSSHCRVRTLGGGGGRTDLGPDAYIDVRAISGL